MTECLLTCEVTANWPVVAVNPSWSTVPVKTSTPSVAYDMTPVWKSASYVPYFTHTILDTMKRLKTVANCEVVYSYKEIDDGSE